MQEQCPHCGNFLVGPAHPLPDQPFFAGEIFALLALAIGGYYFAPAIARLFVTGSIGIIPRTVIAFVLVAVAAWPFEIARERRAKKRDALSCFRRCQSCGYEWDAGQA